MRSCEFHCEKEEAFVLPSPSRGVGGGREEERESEGELEKDSKKRIGKLFPSYLTVMLTFSSSLDEEINTRKRNTERNILLLVQKRKQSFLCKKRSKVEMNKASV